MRVWAFGFLSFISGCTAVASTGANDGTIQQLTVVNTDAPQVSCHGAYPRALGTLTTSAAVRCDDGRTGKIELNTRPDGQPVAGVVHLSNGEMSSVAFKPIAGEPHAYGRAPSLHRVGSRPPPPAGAFQHFFPGSQGGCYYVNGDGRRIEVDKTYCH